jgi:hypothetical protein
MTLFVNAPLADQIFDRLTQFPSFLNSLDRYIEALGMPTWALALVMVVAMVSLVFASREFLAWFLKTNAIADEVIRLESLVRELQQDLKTLEELVAKTKGLAAPQSHESIEPLKAPPTTQFPLHH